MENKNILKFNSILDFQDTYSKIEKYYPSGIKKHSHKIVSISIKCLKKSEFNHKINNGNDTQHLWESIHRNQLVIPPLINFRDNVYYVIDGWQRIELLKNSKIDKVDCLVLSISREKEKQLFSDIQLHYSQIILENIQRICHNEELSYPPKSKGIYKTKGIKCTIDEHKELCELLSFYRKKFNLKSDILTLLYTLKKLKNENY